MVMGVLGSKRSSSSCDWWWRWRRWWWRRLGELGSHTVLGVEVRRPKQQSFRAVCVRIVVVRIIERIKTMWIVEFTEDWVVAFVRSAGVELLVF